jgi:thiosulfate/3-mercaptopyruvate sulfurtransferase
MLTTTSCCNHQIIVYAREGSIFTPRTWFLFRSMGHGNVQLMQGSLEDWMEAGGPVDTESTAVPRAKDLNLSKPSSYHQPATDKPADVIAMDEMLTIVDNQEAVIIIDPRGSSFAKGYIPGSIHLPYSSFVKADNQLQMKSNDELQALFKEAGVDVKSEKPIVCSCGSGVSVCHVYLALQECGREGATMIYDGSWNEWSQNPNAPKCIPRSAAN